MDKLNKDESKAEIVYKVISEELDSLHRIFVDHAIKTKMKVIINGVKKDMSNNGRNGRKERYYD
jgi:hypothetical protein